MKRFDIDICDNFTALKQIQKGTTQKGKIEFVYIRIINYYY